MDSLTLILLSGVIPLYLCASSSDCDDKTQYFEGGKCCFKCGPGSFLAAKCNSNKYSSCEPCQRGFYQPVWTMEDHCQPHTVCDSKGGFEIMQVGDGVRNVQCLCKQGMHCPNKDCEICEHDTACPPGQGVKIPGDRKFQATTCEDCETGFYSNVTSLTEPCKKWMDCSSFSLIEVRAGTTQSDVECGIPYQSNESYKVAIGFLAVLLILCIALFICSRLGQSPPIQFKQQLFYVCLWLELDFNTEEKIFKIFCCRLHSEDFECLLETRTEKVKTTRHHRRLAFSCYERCREVIIMNFP
ncbi:tumor necrosis factor receptor superfamily member 5-like isoform X2 [Rhincodon typus]|uniref:tumor necrosis factor receptor superfamily member 5-like isoform X2 n=1 Tax=Rhincodon typus TaxID=259920 RepID=UPI00202FAF35|nr:tumor necrosis factor receptor superfamily member 5-like isoform X2 [Rhincodon typus]